MEQARRLAEEKVALLNSQATQAQQRFDEAKRREQEAIHTAEKTLHDAELAKLKKSILDRSSVTDPTMIKEAREKFKIDDAYANCVLCGDTGAGKSTAINALRGLRARNRGAARTGVSETTMEAACYEYDDTINIWDVPGFGTDENPVFDEADPGRHYYRRYGIYAFDLVVLLYTTRISEGVCYLARTCQQAGQPFVIVRTKADVDMRSLQIDQNIASETEARYRLREAMKSEIASHLGPDIPSFLVSMRLLSAGECKFDEISLILLLRHLSKH